MKLQRFFLIASCATILSACSQKFPNQPTAYPQGCQGNQYLERYGCSLERLTAAARNGDPDAQYGLGYMYYYGIGTMRDESTARSWIKRAAAQGQPLAVKAYAMMTGHPIAPRSGKIMVPQAPVVKKSSHSMHQAKEDVNQLNQKKPNASVRDQLPGYRNKNSQQNSSMNTSQNQPQNKLVDQAKNVAAQNQNATQNNSAKISASNNNPNNANNSAPQNAQKTAENPFQKSGAMGDASGATKMSSAETWMMHNKGKHYSLQLMGSHDVKAIQKFIAHNHLEGKARYYSAQLEGQNWYMLVYGDFKNERQAEKAAKHLPQPLRARHPWVKSYAEIQKEISDRQVS